MMLKKKVLIILPSPADNKCRLGYKKPLSEWRHWGFCATKDFAWRFENEECKQNTIENFVKDITNFEVKNQNLIVWVLLDKECEVESQNKINKLICLIDKVPEEKYAFYFVYHHGKHASIINNFKDRSTINDITIKQYSLSTIEQFSDLIIDKDNMPMLNHHACFKHFYESFFLNPTDHLKTTIHDLYGFLSPIDVDLQGWIDAGYDYEYWIEIKKSFQRRFKNIDQFCEEIETILLQLSKSERIAESDIKDIIMFDSYGKAASQFKDLIMCMISQSDESELLNEAKNLLKDSNCFCEWRDQFFNNIRHLYEKSK